MRDGADRTPSRELDPLSVSSAGTVVAAVGALVWPQLVSATVTLAALTSFVVWVRLLRALRRPASTGSRVPGLFPFAFLGLTGWSGALLLARAYPAGGALLLGTVCVGFRFLARPSTGGI